MRKKVFPNKACLFSTVLLVAVVVFTVAWSREGQKGDLFSLRPDPRGAPASDPRALVCLQPESAVFSANAHETTVLRNSIRSGLESAVEAVADALGRAVSASGGMTTGRAWASEQDSSAGEPRDLGPKAQDTPAFERPVPESPGNFRSLWTVTHIPLLSALILFLLWMLVLKRKVNVESRALAKTNELIKREIDERRSAEEALRRSEQKYRELVENTNDIIFSTDQSGVLTYISPTVRAAGGYDPSEINKRPFSKFVLDKDLPLVNEYFQRLKIGPVEPIECRIRTRSGEVRWTRLSCRPVFTGDRFTGIQGVLTDITDRKWIEEILHDSEQKFRRIVEQSSDGIIIVDERGVIVEWNKGEEKITGIGRDEAIGRSIWDVHFSTLPPEEKRVESYEKLKDGMLSLLLNGNGPLLDKIQEERILRPDGERRTVQSTVFTINTDRGHMVGSFSRDVTVEKRTEEQIRISLREKEVLLREVHQRVRNNLQVITSLLDMSGRDPGNSVVRNTLAEARNKIYTMALIHAQLYEAERVDRIDMSRYIRELASHIEDMYSPKGTEITSVVRIDDVYLTMNQAIPCALILNELITNAYKHAFTGRPNGTITVSVKREPDSRVVMEVGDDGRGLSAEKTAEGLGMKLVKNIVEVQLNGSLKLSSEGGVLVRIEFDESDCVPG